MKGKRKHRLHITPPEFAEAERYKEEQKLWQPERKPWEIAEDEARRERIRNMKMPAHRPKCIAKILYYDMRGRPVYESAEETRERIWRRAHRRAHKA